MEPFSTQLGRERFLIGSESWSHECWAGSERRSAVQSAVPLAATRTTIELAWPPHSVYNGRMPTEPRPTKQQILDSYEDLKSAERVAYALQREPREIRAALDKYDPEYEKIKRKYTINHHFFHTDHESPDQFYWAGFFAANADICTLVGKNQAYRIQLNLQLEEEDFLKKMLIMFEGTMPVKRITVNNPTKPYTFCRVIISSKYMVHDLKRFNIVPKKKHSYQMPDWLLGHRFLRHFLRGWSDGIGGFFLHDGKLAFRTRGTFEFLNQLRALFRQNLNLVESERPLYEQKAGMGSIQYLIAEDVAQIAKYLYQDAPTFMERKKIAALEIA